MNLALTGDRRFAVVSLAPTDWRGSSVRTVQFATLPVTVTAEKNPTHDPDAKGAEAVQNLFERNRG